MRLSNRITEYAAYSGLTYEEMLQRRKTLKKRKQSWIIVPHSDDVAQMQSVIVSQLSTSFLLIFQKKYRLKKYTDIPRVIRYIFQSVFFWNSQLKSSSRVEIPIKTAFAQHHRGMWT